MNDTPATEAVEEQLRHTLRTVAATVTTDPAAAPAPPRTTRKPRRTRRILLAAGALTVVPVALAAASVVRTGSEYVAPIPPEDIVMTGSLDGSRYLLAESRRTDECGDPVTGVELVEERENLLGSEWSTTGYEYGEYVEKRCDGQDVRVNDDTRYLADPALYNDSGAEVGDSFVWIFTVHPDVDTVRITSGEFSEDLRVYRVDGAGFAPFEIPGDLERFTSEVLVDGQVVPGSGRERAAPSR